VQLGRHVIVLQAYGMPYGHAHGDIAACVRIVTGPQQPCTCCTCKL
jgi:hypothetical protein